MNQNSKIRFLWSRLFFVMFIGGLHVNNADAENIFSMSASISDSLKYIGHSFIKIKTSEGKVIYVDPFNVNEFSDSADVVLITHEHSDHNELFRVKQKATCQVIRSVNAIQGGVYQRFTIGNIKVKAVAAYNSYHAKSDCVGYVIEFDGIKLYHAGDTGKITEMADLAGQDITYALLPMDGIYTMTPEEATQAAAMIHAKYDIPIHTMPPTDTYSSSIAARFKSPNKCVVLPGVTVGLHRSTTRSVPGNFVKIQSAINAAVDGDTVIVDPGVYNENINILGKKIVVTSLYYHASDTSYISSTVINGSSPANPDTASVVLAINNEDSTSILQGFTITGGKGTKWRDEHGAGVYREGGGILIALSSPTIKNNLIIYNTVSSGTGVTSAGGGGIRAGDGNPKILNNVIQQNTGRYGAGVVLNYTGALLKNNVITKNTGGEDYGGGAVWINSNGAFPKILENNTIVNNSATGGGVSFYSGSSIIRNTIIWRNSGAGSQQIGIRSGGPTVTYCDIEGGYSGTGNINSDPLFSDSSFHLGTSSPCVDQGDSSTIYNDPANPNNRSSALWPSLGGVRNDIGVYGGSGRCNLTVAILTTDVRDDVNSGFPQHFHLQQNYPNPFNPSTRIDFSLPHSSYVTLKIYDMLGKEITTLISETLSAGNYSKRWNAFRNPSGIYFYSLQAGNYAETKKLVLIK
jgi:L-ascorbate metabolism protein UlaG (beta-lactamase superfamily)